MFQGLTQGATLFILHKNEPRLEKGRIVSVNTHLPQYNPSQPQAMFGGMVTDISVSVGNETATFSALPASASVANFADKGLFLCEEQGLAMAEIKAMRDNSQRIIDSYEAQKAMRDKCDELLLSLDPERQAQMRNAEEMAVLKNELAELKGMLSAVLSKKEK